MDHPHEHEAHAAHARAGVAVARGTSEGASSAGSQPERCAFCGMAITPPPVVRVVDGHEVHFDSEDCARIYEVAADQGLLDVVLAEAPEHRHRLFAGLTSPIDTAFFDLDGMWCASCASVAEKVLLRTEGIESAQVSFAAGKGRIDYDPQRTDLTAVVSQLERLGYRPVFTSTAEEAAQGRAEEHLLIQLLVAFAFGMQVMVLYIVKLYGAYRIDDYSQQILLLQYLAWGLTTPALFYGGFSILRGAWRATVARTANMDTLVALGTLSAYTYSAWACLAAGHPTYFDSVAMIVQFVMLGRYLEAVGGARARKDVQGLLELQPTKAWVRSDRGTFDEVPAAQVVPGDVILVKPGERVPVDAQVIEGTAHADESLLTGESAAVPKSAGATLWAGTLVLDGSLTGSALHDVNGSRLAGIRALVSQTLAAKAPVERLADKVSAYLTFGIMGVALVTGVGWVIAGSTPSEALITAVAVLVVACPCALGLATPLAVSVALGAAAREGVLVRNGAALETASMVTDVALDKTGTVTLGRLEVVDVQNVDGEPDGLVCRAAAVEQYSEHPLARAINLACPRPPKATGFKADPGLGASAVLDDGATVRVGRLESMPERPTPAVSEAAATRASRGETLVWVSEGPKLLGFIALRDELDPTAGSAVGLLSRTGVAPVILSGDSEETTQAVSRDLGVEDSRARLAPEDKAAFVAGLQAEGRRVAMIGDGINDAPSLAQADLSITVAGGTDVAGETSDVVFSRRDLTLAPWFLGLSAVTRRVIRQNLGWALGYNLVAVPVAAFGLITPGIAAVAMATSSLLVVGNSLRLRRLIGRLD